jgi:hypothetical protein
MCRWSIPGLPTILAILVATGAVAAPAGEPVAVLTEIRAGQGEVRVKLAAETDWTAPLPLLSLRSGDQIRATRNAAAVLLFTGGQGTVTVSAANSPYTLQTPSVTSSSPIRDLVASLGQLLMGQKKELVQVPLATRRVEGRPLLLSPRDGTLLGAPTFEWAGSDWLPYTVRVSGPEGALWEQSNLPRTPLTYPASAPHLRPGVAYRWELEGRGFPVEQGRFTILPEAEAAAVRATLASLLSPALPGYPRNTVVLMRAVYLFERGLFTEARAELQAALAADPDEPSLHVMLGRVYERTGPPELALGEFDEAQFLSAGGH